VAKFAFKPAGITWQEYRKDAPEPLFFSSTQKMSRRLAGESIILVTAVDFRPS
jgi:hypothetical protein